MKGSKLLLSDREKDAMILCLIKQKQNPKYLSSGFSDLESMYMIASLLSMFMLAFLLCVHLLHPLNNGMHGPKKMKSKSLLTVVRT